MVVTFLPATIAIGRHAGANGLAIQVNGAGAA